MPCLHVCVSYITVCFYIIIIFVGILTTSAIVIYTYFWLLYVCHLALKVFYPMKSVRFFNSDHSRIIYIAEILIILLIGTVPSIIVATVGSNYGTIGFPVIYCAINSTYRIYVIVLPVLVTNGASVILMLLVIYRLHLVSLMVYVYTYVYALVIVIIIVWDHS